MQIKIAIRILNTNFLLILLLFLTSCSSSVISNDEKRELKCHKTFTTGQLNEDFLILTSVLQEAHPDLYRVSSREKIDQRIEEIKEEIKESKSYLEFLKLIAPLFTDIGCINTQWGHSKSYIDFRNENIPVFSLQIDIRDNRFFIENNFSGDPTIEPGSEIIEMNGKRMNQYLDENYPFLPRDGNIKTIQQKWLAAYFPQHHSNFWEQPDTFNLMLNDGNGNSYEKAVPALLKNQINDNRVSTPARKNPLRFSTEEGVSILTLESFNKNVLSEYNQDFESFVDSCFRELKEKSMTSLIIDLRGNGWGEINYGAHLMSYLVTEPFVYIEAVKSEMQKDYTYPEYVSVPEMNPESFRFLTQERTAQPAGFQGPVYVITDGWNVHAKGLFCAKASERAEIFFVGEECGASAFGMNINSLSLTLPHTGIHFSIPTAQIIVNSANYYSTECIPIDHAFQAERSFDVLFRTFEYISETQSKKI